MSSTQVGRSKDPRVIGYPHRLNWYNIPPPYELTVQQFELWALDRLAVLKSIETAQVRNIKKDDEIKTYMRETLKKYLPLTQNTNRDTSTNQMRQDQFNDRKKDHTSHFLLRLAYSRTEDLRSWFLKMETELFRIRLLDEGIDATDKFLLSADDLDTVHVDLSVVPSLKEEKELHGVLVKELAQLLGLPEQDIQKQTFFRVDFEKVPDLVQKRMVVVKGGYAYVPSSMKTVIIVNEFKDRLKLSLEATAKALPRMDEDDRLDPILNSISQQYISTRNASYGQTSANEVSWADVDGLAAKHFPLCMQNLHKSLRSDAHLKHSARLQYGLFLKGIGMSMQESLVFWRKAFCRMTDDAFQKGGYAYNVRHSYGMEGKRSNYAPYSCVKIITSNQPSATEHHGCPFRHYNQDNLKTLLTQTISASESVPSSVTNSVNDILKIVSDGHYQIACTRMYEIVHNKGDKNTIDVIDHPNEWFELSTGTGTVKKEKKEDNKEDVEMADN